MDLYMFILRKTQGTHHDIMMFNMANDFTFLEQNIMKITIITITIANKLWCYLLLQGENVSHAAINGVSNSGLSFISNGDYSLTSIRNWHMQQELRHITRSKHLVYGGEPSRALLRAEVGGENAVRRALSPQKLARSAG